MYKHFIGQKVILLRPTPVGSRHFEVGETYEITAVNNDTKEVVLEDSKGHLSFFVPYDDIMEDYDIDEYATEHDGRGRRRDDMMPRQASYEESRAMIRKALEERGVTPIEESKIDYDLREYERLAARHRDDKLRQLVRHFENGDIVYYHTGAGGIAKVFSRMPTEVGIKFLGDHIWVSPDEISKPVALEPIAKGERVYVGEYVKCFITPSGMYTASRFSGKVISRKERFLRSDIYLVELTDGTTSEFTEDQLVERYVFAVEPRVLAEAKLPGPIDTKEEKPVGRTNGYYISEEKSDKTLHDLLGGESAKHSWTAHVTFANNNTTTVAVVTSTKAIHEASLAITDAFVERDGMVHGTDFFVSKIEYSGKVAAI